MGILLWRTLEGWLDSSEINFVCSPFQGRSPVVFPTGPGIIYQRCREMELYFPEFGQFSHFAGTTNRDLKQNQMQQGFSPERNRQRELPHFPCGH